MDAGDIDDYIKWFGSRKPVAFAWYGLALLEIAASIFILTKAYVMYNNEIDDALRLEDIVGLLYEKDSEREE